MILRKMFTNWLTSEAPNKAHETASLSTAPPDMVVEVGPPPFTRFPAHSTILSQQSGYFRAAIGRVSEVGKLSESAVYLPNITVDHFTPLFTYMYTGFLELNFENIFGVLLATHLLHMPRALEICRDFLAHTQRQQSDFYSAAVPTSLQPSSSKVVRPIASKASNLGLNFVSPPKAPSSLLVPSHDTPFKSFALSPAEEAPIKIPKLHDIKQKERISNDDRRSVVPKPIAINNSSHRKMPARDQLTTKSESDKVIIDIASCDGPVRFRRVLNDAYEHNKKQIVAPNCASEVVADLKYHQSNVLSFHQQMVRNINEQYSKQKSFSSLNSEESENSQQSNDIYTCVYCNHTFKSKYCYQKHAKRHLNPLNLKSRDDCESSDGEAKKSESTSVKRDSIKPLDMNVQYYPCKTCGCKFPSYYFVHKHRKLCHPEIAADGSIQAIPNDSIDEIQKIAEEIVTEEDVIS